MPYGWKIEFNGVDISEKVSRFSITADLENYCREMTLDIADADLYSGLDFTQIPETAEIEIFTKTESTWISQGSFFIERPAIESSTGSDLLQGVWGRSITAKLGEPFAPKVSKRWEEKTTFFNIASEMCTLAGITWDEAFSDIDDFVIYAGTYETESAYPIDVIAKIASLAGAVAATDRLGHLCIKSFDYVPSEADVTITDDDIAEISESPEWPEFANRVRITPTGALAGYAISLLIPDPCLQADGASRTKLFAQVIDEQGEPVDGQVVDWSIASSNAAISSATSNTQEILISVERQRATNFYTISVDFPPSWVDGVWAYSDHARRTNLAAGGYSLSANTITLHDKLSFCDQSLVITYRSAGIAVNYIQAGSVAEDVTVSVDVEGETAENTVFIDNPCQCPPRLSLTANPTSVHVGEVASLLVYVEESGPVTTGRTVYMSEGSAAKRGDLSWNAARLGTVTITNEKATAINEITGVTQCEISMYPASVTSVYLADEEGNPTGGDLYGTHSGKVIDLSTIVSTGADLLVNYTAQGAALNHFTGETIGTARIDAYIRTTREEPTEASASISVVDETSAIDDWPEDWDASDLIYGGVGTGEYDSLGDALCRQSDGTIKECAEGERCCWTGTVFGCFPESQCTSGEFNWCVPENVSSDPTEAGLNGRFTDGLAHGCSCEEMCATEFEIFGTTQSYDGGSYRTVSDMVKQDHGFEEGTPEYWEKVDALKAEAIAACVNYCDVCEDAEILLWDEANNPETINPDDEVTLYVTGGIGPYTWSIAEADTPDSFHLVSIETEAGANVLQADADAAGSVNILVTDRCGNACDGWVRSTAGLWDTRGATTCGAARCKGAAVTIEHEYQDNHKRWEIAYDNGTDPLCSCWCTPPYEMPSSICDKSERAEALGYPLVCHYSCQVWTA